MDYIIRFLSRIHWDEISVLIISILALTLAIKFVQHITQNIAERHPKKRMKILAWLPIFSFVSYLGGTIIIFYLVINPAREIAIGLIAWGIVALGFALKDIAGCLVAGIAIVMDKPFQVGDRITFDKIYGDVISIGLISVKVNTIDESIITIPNHKILLDVVKSNSAGEFGMATTIEINLKPTVDLIKAQNILRKIALNSPYVDSRSSASVLAKEKLLDDGQVIIIVGIKCVLKDARTEKDFHSDFIIAANKALREKKHKSKTKKIISG